MRVINRVRDNRFELGMSQEELANLLDISKQSLALIEAGKYNPSILLALQISQILHKPVESVFILK